MAAGAGADNLLLALGLLNYSLKENVRFLRREPAGEAEGAGDIALGHSVHCFSLCRTLGCEAVWTFSDGQSNALELHLYFYLLVNMNFVLGAQLV